MSEPVQKTVVSLECAHPPDDVSTLIQQVYALAASRDRRFKYRWVLSPTHVQAFHDAENERLHDERERLADIPNWLPGFDPTEHLKWVQPLPPPDLSDGTGMRLLDWPVRIADVDEITLEPLDRTPPYELFDNLVDAWERMPSKWGGDA